MIGIHVEKLAKRFGDFTAVEGLSFDVLHGEVFGLLGPNGAGKTTTVRMLAGLLRPSTGIAEVLGMSISTQADGIRRRIGLLTEQPGLYDRLTARENLEFYIRLHEVDSVTAWKETERLLERFGLAERQHEPVGTYSKGMRQKLAIVRTLIHHPDVLFLDEPTSGLDPESARTVRDAIEEWAQAGKAIILCSHNLAEVERLCHRVAIVKNRLRVVASLRDLGADAGEVHVEMEHSAQDFVKALPVGLREGVAAEGTTLRLTKLSAVDTPDVVAALVKAQARIQQVVRKKRTLEELYLQYVRPTEREGLS